jgi:hypothetical protein
MGTIKNKIKLGVPAGKKIPPNLVPYLKINNRFIQINIENEIVMVTIICVDIVNVYGIKPPTLKKNNPMIIEINELKNKLHVYVELHNVFNILFTHVKTIIFFSDSIITFSLNTSTNQLKYNRYINARSVILVGKM